MTSINPTYVNYALEPMYFNDVPLLASWYRIFPFATWGYYPPTATLWEIGGNTQALSAMLVNKASYGWIYLSQSQLATLNKTPGWSSFVIPSFNNVGISPNPRIYPYNIPQVREALCDVINRTAVAALWGLAITLPSYYPEPVSPTSMATFPSDVR